MSQVAQVWLLEMADGTATVVHAPDLVAAITMSNRVLVSTSDSPPLAIVRATLMPTTDGYGVMLKLSAVERLLVEPNFRL